MEQQRLNIAIDGPSGAGKSTLAKALAKRLQIVYLDTGAMYRAIGLYALENGVGTKDDAGLAALLQRVELSVEMTPQGQRVLLSGRDVTDQIRTSQVSMAASDVSSIPIVREKLVSLQREIARGKDIVLDGRDIGTNVLPHSRYKFFITASAQERAKRRHQELIQKGESIPYEKVLSDVIRRDEQDTNRKVNPLRPAPDAYIIDTEGLDEEQVLEKVLSILQL